MVSGKIHAACAAGGSVYFPLAAKYSQCEEARKEDKENSTLKPEYRELELEFEEWKE